MQKVSAIEAAKNFVIAQKLKKKYTHINNIADYRKIYAKIKKEVESYSEPRVWKLVTDTHRRKRYKKLQWYKGKVGLKQVGVWPRMGHLADNLLIKSAKWSVNKIYTASGTLLKGQLNHLFRIIPFAQFLNNQVPIIVIQGGTIRKKQYLIKKYDVDDGCHRLVCLGLLGRNIVNAYIGLEKK